MNKTTIAYNDDLELWRVITSGYGGSFKIKVDAVMARSLCEAAYKAGRHDHAQDLKQLLDE